MEAMMGEVIGLHRYSFLDDHELITDCARFAEGLLSEKEVKKRHRFDDATWNRLGEDDVLLRVHSACLRGGRAC
jgi:hypothetical protein